MVLRNSKGDFVRTSSKILSCESAFIAELYTLKWALELAELHGWINLLWSSYATNLVKEILSEEESEGWSSRDAILPIRSKISCYNWKL